jgi:hypothetical protein
MIRFATLALILILPAAGRAQTPDDSDVRVTLFPSGLLFMPLKANSQESRTGIMKFLNASELVLDVGNASDLFTVSAPRAGLSVAMGVDFFGKGFVTGSQGFRLQVDALDGFFGGHLSFMKALADSRLTGRLRILHQSAHLVDGHYDVTGGNWIDHRGPIPFTRDFGEFTLGHVLPYSSGSLRYYGGVAYAVFVRPADLGRLSYLGGAELTLESLLGPVKEQPSQLYLAYHVSLTGTPVYAASNQIQLGIKLGRWSGRGADFYLAFYNGRQLFGEYFDQRLAGFGAGCMVDVF